MNIIDLNIVKAKLIEVREKKVLLDFDVAEIYGVETKRINEAVKNNPDKYPNDYIISMDEMELENLRSKISTTKLSKTRVAPKAFTEKGLYMLATILKSRQATQTTIAIIETFSKVRELTQTVNILSTNPEKEEQK